MWTFAPIFSIRLSVSFYSVIIKQENRLDTGGFLCYKRISRMTAIFLSDTKIIAKKRGFVNAFRLISDRKGSRKRVYFSTSSYFGRRNHSEALCRVLAPIQNVNFVPKARGASGNGGEAHRDERLVIRGTPKATKANKCFRRSPNYTKFPFCFRASSRSVRRP